MMVQAVAHDVPRGLTTLTKVVPRGRGEHVARLTRWFESTFDCQDGDKRAYTPHPALSATEKQERDFLDALDGKNEITATQEAVLRKYADRPRIAYTILGFSCEGGAEREEELCDALRNSVIDLIAAHAKTSGTLYGAVLYWRRKPELNCTAASDDVDFDTGLPGKTAASARLDLRIAIPGLNLNECAAAVCIGCPAPRSPA